MTDERIQALAATAKPYRLTLLHWEKQAVEGACHGFPGDALPA
ncbi:hypothetical protein AB0K12_38925 [Nonomuraea sp. NPDC049419]